MSCASKWPTREGLSMTAGVFSWVSHAVTHVATLGSSPSWSALLPVGNSIASRKSSTHPREGSRAQLRLLCVHEPRRSERALAHQDATVHRRALSRRRTIPVSSAYRQRSHSRIFAHRRFVCTKKSTPCRTDRVEVTLTFHGVGVSQEPQPSSVRSTPRASGSIRC